jgi:hypothetical protein
MYAFKGDDRIICDHATRNKGTLLRRNNLPQPRAQPVYQALRYDFVNDVAQTDRPEIFELLWVVAFWNKDYGRIINTRGMTPLVKNN